MVGGRRAANKRRAVCRRQAAKTACLRQKPEGASLLCPEYRRYLVNYCGMQACRRRISIYRCGVGKWRGDNEENRRGAAANYDAEKRRRRSKSGRRGRGMRRRAMLRHGAPWRVCGGAVTSPAAAAGGVSRRRSNRRAPAAIAGIAQHRRQKCARVPLYELVGVGSC